MSLLRSESTIATSARAAIVTFVAVLGIGWYAAIAMAGEAEAQTQAPGDVVSDKIVLQMKPVVEIDNAQADIMLIDLIVTHGLSRTATEELQAVRLADAPRAGETRLFSDFGLTDVLKPHLERIQKKTGETFTLRIPTRVVVSRKKFRLQQADVEKELLRQFHAMCSECEFEIANLAIPRIPENDHFTSWSLKAGATLPRGGFSLPFESKQDNGTHRTYWVNGTLTVRRTVAVLGRAVNALERLSAQDYTMQSRDVTFANDVPATVSELQANVTARALAANEPIWRSSLNREIAIKSGDAVKVVAGNEAWEISIDGVAQSQGYIGDLVSVKIPKTQKLISGTLRERGLIEVRQ
jgi:flagella basal body P-ring formation protein FlgA